jgi:hypothetical protein
VPKSNPLRAALGCSALHRAKTVLIRLLPLLVCARLATAAIADDASPAPESRPNSAPATSAALPTPGDVLAPANAAAQILVPRGTLVVVTTNHGTNSYGEQTGSKLTFTLVQDVIVNGYVIAKAGDVAEGAVSNSEAGRDDFFTQKAANLRISVDRVYNFCGDTLSTDFTRSEYRRRQGIMGSHKDVEIVKGQMYQVPTERAQRICAEPTTARPLPIPTQALLGDSK